MTRVCLLLIVAGVAALIAGLWASPWLLFAGLAAAFLGLHGHAAATDRQQHGHLTPRQLAASNALWAEFHATARHTDRRDA
jgi:hypothetical protein